MSKKVLAIDIDEVLGFHNEALADHHNELYGTAHTVDEYHDDWGLIWGVDEHEAERRADVWHDSVHWENIQPIPGALDAVKKLKEKYDLVILTGRAGKLADKTHEWLDKHYPGLFEKALFVGLYEEGKGKTKADIAVEHNVQVLVDDNLEQVIACNNIGIQSILFGEYNWNKTNILPVGVVRALNWEQVLNILL